MSIQSRNPSSSFTKPFAHVHTILTGHGFDEVAGKENSFYELPIRVEGEEKGYPFRVYTRRAENNQLEVDLSQAQFAGEGQVPEAASAQADKLLGTLREKLQGESYKNESTPIDEAQNGRMTSNEEEVKQLGKAMSDYPTNKEVRESGMVPDPIQ
ncbi:MULTISPECIES: hypothetical protein [Paenibacillus]|uniref:hypothetical protein n=1 Tax=Paenibacillus TaxID=44249 RepID=UPI0022B93EDF|nr:hypothetical protein [Paenibacillus caseinilyticus]MCZ8522553.1 hypothetical protein [Paenibacillus caseinilyticus]